MPDKDINLRKRIFWAQLGAYLLIVSIAMYGFWALGRQQDDLQRSQTCTEEFLGATVKALNERTSYTTAQADANVELQRAQLLFIRTLISPKSTDQQSADALGDYFDALNKYNRIVSLSAGKADQFPYPSSEDYRACLQGGDVK